MVFFLLKAIVSGLVIAVVSTVARRSPAVGALVASLPLISVMGMLWLWWETHDVARMRTHVAATFWYVLPSLPMFLLIPALMRANVPFYAALALGCLTTIILYGGMLLLGRRWGLEI